MGSKSRIAKYIVPILQKTINDNNVTTFYDIFCGGCNIIDKIHAEKRIAVDSNPYLIALWKHIQADLPLLDTVDRELYNNVKRELKTDVYPNWVKGNVGFLASYNGKFFDGGYAKPGIEKTKYGERKRDYYDEAKRNILKQTDLVKDIEFACANYASIEPKNAVVYCFDKETEILTKDGWKYFKDIDINKDVFLSREPNTKILDYLRANYYTHYHYNGKMCHYIGRQIDFKVTPDHKIFCAKKVGAARTKVEQFLTAQEFSTKGQNWVFIKGGAIWGGKNSKMFNLCGQSVDFVKFSRLLGIFLTDGSVNNQGNITINQKKPHIIKIIRELLQELKIKHTEYKCGDGVICFYISKQYKDFFQQFYNKQKRHIPLEFKNASKEAIMELIEGILDGDSDSERRRIWLSSKPLVDDIQECLFKIGKASNYSITLPKTSYLASEDRYIQGKINQYTISIIETENPVYQKNNIVWEDYDDEVYCVTLEKWHTVLVRRNGKTIWLGQCDPPYQSKTGYKNSKNFDYDKFWEIIRQWSKNNWVFVSEESAPNDMTCIWEQEVSRSLNPKNKTKATEKLFIYEGE